MDITTHRLTAKHLNEMRALNLLFADAFDDPMSYVADPPTDAYLTDFLSDTNHIAIVATEDRKVVGGVVAYVLNKFEKQRSEVYVYDLAVSVSHRRLGIAKRLMSDIQLIAKEHGAYVVFVQADDGEEAVNFYRSLSPDDQTHTHTFDFDVK